MLVIFNHKSMLFIVVIIFFSFHITKKLTLKKLPPPFRLKKIIIKLNLFLKLSIEKINGTSTPSGVKITFSLKNDLLILTLSKVTFKEKSIQNRSL